jgi:hypothetical protein
MPKLSVSLIRHGQFVSILAFYNGLWPEVGERIEVTMSDPPGVRTTATVTEVDGKANPPITAAEDPPL